MAISIISFYGFYGYSPEKSKPRIVLFYPQDGEPVNNNISDHGNIGWLQFTVSATAEKCGILLAERTQGGTQGD
ncbi:MAG: hypothetical protein IIY55_05240, partial [Blautia sp.]|nr:hypothetical protein [Blautia sp.]